MLVVAFLLSLTMGCSKNSGSGSKVGNSTAGNSPGDSTPAVSSTAPAGSTPTQPSAPVGSTPSQPSAGFFLETAGFPFISTGTEDEDGPETLNMGDVICVDGSSTGPQDGTPSNPYRTIQAAVDAASDSKTDTIKVAGGTYRETVRISQKKVRLLGGFVGGGDFTDANPLANKTVIEGTGAAPCIFINIDEHALSGALVICGFTICKGQRGIELTGA